MTKGMKRLDNNDRVKFFLPKIKKKSHQVIMKRRKRINNCPLLTCLRQVFVNSINFIPRGYSCTTNPYRMTHYALNVAIVRKMFLCIKPPQCNIKGLTILGGLSVSQYTLLLSPQKKGFTVKSTVMLVWKWVELFEVRKIVISGLIRNAGFLLHVCQWYSYRSGWTYWNCLIKNIFREKQNKIK